MFEEEQTDGTYDEQCEEGQIKAIKRADEDYRCRSYIIRDRYSEVEAYYLPQEDTTTASPEQVDSAAGDSPDRTLQQALNKLAAGMAVEALGILNELSQNPNFLHLSLQVKSLSTFLRFILTFVSVAIIQKRALLFLTTGSICSSKGSNLRAIDHYVKALAVYNEIVDDLASCELLGKIAQLLTNIKNYGQAMQYFNNQIMLATNINNSALRIQGMLGLGTCYMAQYTYEKAVVVFNKCLAIFGAGLGTERGHIVVAKTCLANLGICYHQLGAFEEALDSFETCLLALSRSPEDVLEGGTVKVHTACTLLMLQRYDDAIAAGHNYVIQFLMINH